MEKPHFSVTLLKVAWHLPSLSYRFCSPWSKTVRVALCMGLELARIITMWDFVSVAEMCRVSATEDFQQYHLLWAKYVTSAKSRISS